MLQTEAETKNSEFIKGRVLRWFTDNSGWLLVLDNAPDYETIKSFLPTKGGKTLITSRAAHWEESNRVASIPVYIMEEAEAIELMQRLSGYDDEILNVKELVKTLGYLPLAIAQAAAYIRQQNKQISYTVKDYLAEYKQEHKELLKEDSLSQAWSGTPHEPVAVTWLMNIKDLHKKEPLTIFLMHCCAYFDSKNIPQALLKVCLQRWQPNLTDISFRKILNYTQAYSLLTLERNHQAVSIHRLVQTVIQGQSNQKEKQEIILDIIQAIKKEYPEKEPTMADVERRRNLIVHMQSVYQNSEKMLGNVDKVERDLLQLPLLLGLGDVYNDSGDAHQKKALLERALGYRRGALRQRALASRDNISQSRQCPWCLRRCPPTEDVIRAGVGYLRGALRQRTLAIGGNISQSRQCP